MMGPYTLGFIYVAPQHHDGRPLEHNWIARQGSEDFARLVDYKMDFQPGAIPFVNNRHIMHGRADYEDHEGMERRRLLLRLWLTIPAWQKYPEYLPHSDAELMTEPA